MRIIAVNLGRGNRAMRGRNNNFHYMFAALLMFLVLLPLLGDMQAMPEYLGQTIAISCLLAIGVWSLRRDAGMFRVSIGLAIVGIGLSLFGFGRASETATLLALGPFAAFLALSIWAALRQVMYGPEMSSNRLMGVVCVYLLLGILWATLYAGVYRLDPTAFSGIESTEKTGLTLSWVYYSFVTLTTLGYGDILPLSVAARVLAYSEAVFGVFYMATLVAMLVSAYSAEVSRKDQ